MLQSNHDVRFSVVDSIMVGGRTISILCVGDYAQAKKRLFQYAQSMVYTHKGG